MIYLFLAEFSVILYFSILLTLLTVFPSMQCLLRNTVLRTSHHRTTQRAIEVPARFLRTVPASILYRFRTASVTGSSELLSKVADLAKQYKNLYT